MQNKNKTTFRTFDPACFGDFLFKRWLGQGRGVGEGAIGIGKI